MLATPIGNIDICLDGTPIIYEVEVVDKTKVCQDLSGRFKINVPFVPDGKSHNISCRITDYIPSEQDDIESGERLEMKSFYQGNVKLSIGMKGDSAYLSDGKRITEVDYDISYLKDGVQYEILSFTQTSNFVFGIAWLENCNEKNEIQTWFGADPNEF